MFDIITKKEVSRKRIPFMSKILKVFAEKCTPNCGIYIINDNGVLYDLSWRNGELIFKIQIGQFNKKMRALIEQKVQEEQILIEQFKKETGEELSSKDRTFLRKIQEKQALKSSLV